MPDWKSLVRERIASLKVEGSAESALSEELGQHLEDRYREHLSGGSTEQEAYEKVISELEDLHPLQAGLQRSQIARYDQVPVGEANSGNLFDDLWRDVRYADRSMRKSPVFVLFVVLTLGLGIGANTTVFTLINTMILNPLPVPDSSSLTAVGVVKAGSKSNSNAMLPMSFADLKDYRAGNRSFGSLAGYTSPRVLTWQADAGAERMFTELVTSNYFSTLGLNPSKGRFFLPQEDGVAGAHPVAVLNYGTWQTRFGGASDIVGKTLRLNKLAFTVIGVAPPQFIGVNALFGPDVWIPADMASQLFPNELPEVLTDRSRTVFQGVGRLKAGVTRAQAQANLAGTAAALARQYPGTHEGHTAVVRPIREALYASSMGGANSILVASSGLLVVVAIVLLIACSNVANLLLARSANREQEIAIRLAMGASRRRLIRQLLTESVLLGLLSGTVGFLIGYAGLHVLFGALPSTSNFIAPKLDATVFIFAFCISVVTGLLFGILPALKTSHTSLADTLKQDSRTSGKSRRKVTIGNALLVGQVAFSFVLLVTATLFLRSIQHAYNLDPGFQTAHLAIFMTSPGQAGYSKPQTKAFYKDVRERVARIPGVESVAWASNLPLWARSVNGLEIEGRQPKSQADQITTIVNTVDSDYFQTSGIAIDSGRAFTSLDQENSLPVAIVNEKIAHDYWPGGSAIGKRIRLPGQEQMRQIVGVARTVNYTAWGEPPQPCVYLPLEQSYSDAMTLYVRSSQNPRGLLVPVQRELHEAAPQVYSADARTGREIVDGGLFQVRMGVAMLTTFGLLALGLASVGLYGILAYSVNQRKREIGVRIALGAGRASVLQLVIRQGMALVLTGVVIGLVAALLVGQALGRMLYGLTASDPVSILSATSVLLIVALLACYLPARWASRVDPLAALREG